MAEQLSPKLVLVIEDHSVLLAILADLLRRERLEVVEAVDGGAGIELAKRHRPDLIISDYWMPTASGVDVLQAVRQDNATAGIPFLMLTADTSPAQERGS
jgi:CheY-like chemotaxis protein